MLDTSSPRGGQAACGLVSGVSAHRCLATTAAGQFVRQPRARQRAASNSHLITVSSLAEAARVESASPYSAAKSGVVGLHRGGCSVEVHVAGTQAAGPLDVWLTARFRAYSTRGLPWHTPVRHVPWPLPSEGGLGQVGANLRGRAARPLWRAPDRCLPHRMVPLLLAALLASSGRVTIHPVARGLHRRGVGGPQAADGGFQERVLVGSAGSTVRVASAVRRLRRDNTVAGTRSTAPKKK